jgi:hypothetical protein
MNNNNTGTKSYIKIYWYIWLSLVIILFAIRFTIFRYSSEDVLFFLFAIYAFPTWLAVMILNYVEGHRLMGYLERNHKSTWEDITWIPFVGSGGVNSFRTLFFLFSGDDLGDEVVKKLTKNYRQLLALMLIIFFSFIIIFLTIMIIKI